MSAQFGFGSAGSSPPTGNARHGKKRLHRSKGSAWATMVACVVVTVRDIGIRLGLMKKPRKRRVEDWLPQAKVPATPGQGWTFIGGVRYRERPHEAREEPLHARPDIDVAITGTVASISAASLAGRAWIAENLPPDLPRVGDEALVDRDMIAGIVERATGAGLKVQQRPQGSASSAGDG